MHKLILTFLMCLSISGCFIANRFDEQKRAIYAKNNASIDELNNKCSNLTYNENTIIYDEIMSEFSSSPQVPFPDVICPHQNDSNCIQKFSNIHFARMQEKYIGADWKASKLYADGHPQVYQNPRHFELVILKSHNKAVKDYCESKRAEIVNHTSNAISEVNRNQQEAISEAFSSFGSKSSSKCYSSGNSVRCYHD